MAAPDDLVRRARSGDVKALNALLELHLPMVYRFVSMRLGPNSADVDDVVQEILIAAARSSATLKAEREGAVPAWFLTIARHKLADHFRRSPARTDELVPQTLTESPDVHEIVAKRDRDRRLREAMHDLTSEQEEVLVLRFVLGFDIDQTAEITGRTPGAVKALQHRGLAGLEKVLRSGGEEWS